MGSNFDVYDNQINYTNLPSPRFQQFCRKQCIYNDINTCLEFDIGR